MITNLHKLVTLLIDDLGHYSEVNNSICLYQMPTAKAFQKELRKKIDSVTTKYRLIVLEPKEVYSNINILDIDL